MIFQIQYTNSVKIEESCLPEKPTWSVRSLLPTTSSILSKPIITQKEYESILNLSNLHSTSLENSQLIQDINILCYFVKHIQEVDVSDIEPMRNVWAGGVNLNLREEEENNKQVNDENQGRVLLKSASLLHNEFYVVNKAEN
ncbi:1474_t:CDS:2 [Funneliformis geosporum]|uniref:5520_t:CDS:1 n=1 Tax=Funneliformis geosporum TaxID=1117311 RepID=A0A9W4SW00_9GLOM|nr:5520_t:CDS:2 [Funneliformis geosporum]CAI2184917.1 1474_t:CDS:2 [Funneliformis geosporum]